VTHPEGDVRALRAQPKPHRSSGSVTDHRASKGRPVAATPLGGAADQDRQVGAAGALEQARRGGGAFAVPAHHHGRPGRDVAGMAGERSKFDQVGCRQVSGGVFGLLPDIDHGASVHIGR
jgi:hypothetical protein